MQQNDKYRLYSGKDETINYMVSECSKLAQKKYKTRHKCSGVIHLQFCKKLKLDHTTKWYTHKPESVMENETHKILRDFEIEIDYLILVRWLDLVLIKEEKKKENLLSWRFCHPNGLHCENWRKWKERQAIKTFQITKEAVEHRADKWYQL